jgi:tRNA nucleotidyltransferase (CCA-adding enzyme)
MQVYLVGGAVRDRLLGRAVKDRDYVVVGATPEEMLAAGYQPVGKDFPVFLHPTSRAEYALARTERKSGRGYHGFVFATDPTVTLEDDLVRRDLTINAMAEAADGTLVDPYGGRRDLEARVLRHVSPAFAEDPLRLLRVARFAARYAPLGFVIADETLDLMRAIVAAGEVDHLTAERVWAETERALAEPAPQRFLQALRASGALARLFPAVDRLYGVPQRAEFHPEVDTGVHLELVLEAAARVAPGDALVGFLALTHDLGKGLTPSGQLPRHDGHEESGVPEVEALCERYRVPSEFRELAVLTCRWHLAAHRALTSSPDALLDLIGQFDAFRRPARLAAFLAACEADQRGRLGKLDSPYPQRAYLLACHAAAAAVSAESFVRQGLRGPQIGQAMTAGRRAAIANLPR